MRNSVLNWSGGKDSALSLYHCLKDDKTDVKLLLTTLSETFGRVSMHGVRRELLQLQARNLGVELKEIFLPENTSIGIYDLLMKKNLTELKTDGIDYSIFGDIFLEDLREYREKRLAEIPMAALFPLWGRSTSEIMNEFISLGFKAVVTCVNEKYLDKSSLGRYLDNAFLNDLPNNVDPCGENGEFHTFVFDGPLFRKPVEFEFGEIVYKNYKPISDSKDDECYSENVQTNFDTGFWYMDLLGKPNEE